MKKFCSSCKNIDHWAKSERPKTIDPGAVHKDIEETLVVGEYQASSVSHSRVWFVTFTNLAKASRSSELYQTLSKYRKTFDPPSYFLLSGTIFLSSISCYIKCDYSLSLGILVSMSGKRSNVHPTKIYFCSNYIRDQIIFLYINFQLKNFKK